MILTEFQSHKVSPCCNTSRRQHTASSNRTISMRSRECSLFRKDFDIRPSIFSSLREQKINIKTAAPKGAFLRFLSELSGNTENCGSHIQKHYLQPMWSVKASSRIEPSQALIPKTLITRPMYSGLSFKGAIYVTIASAPCRRPAAPMPAIARSVMKIEEDRAAAQMVDPTT